MTMRLEDDLREGENVVRVNPSLDVTKDDVHEWCTNFYINSRGNERNSSWYIFARMEFNPDVHQAIYVMIRNDPVMAAMFKLRFS